MYEPTEKVALQIHGWQVDANIFKVMRYSLLRDFIWFLCSLLHCRLQRKEPIQKVRYGPKKTVSKHLKERQKPNKLNLQYSAIRN